MSTSCCGNKLVEFEGKGMKRKTYQVLDIHLTNAIDEGLDADARKSSRKYSVDPKPGKSGKWNRDTNRSEKRKKTDDVLSSCARKLRPESRRKDLRQVERQCRSDKQLLSTMERSRDHELCQNGFEKKRGTWKRELDALVSPERNRWSMTQVEGGDCATQSSDMHERLNLNVETIVVSRQTKPLLRNNDEAKQSKIFPKRSRDGNLRGLVEAKKKKSGTKGQLGWKSEAKVNNHAFVDGAATKVDNEVSTWQLRRIREDARAEFVKSCRWVNHTLDEGRRRYGEIQTQGSRVGSQEENGVKVGYDEEDVRVKHRERRARDLHQGPRICDGASYKKDRRGRATTDYTASPAPFVGSDCMRSGTGIDQRKLFREVKGVNTRADRRLDTEENVISNSRGIDNGYVRERSMYRVHEVEDGRKPSHRNADYLDRVLMKEKQELRSREVRKSERCAMIDLTRTKYDSSSVITRVWEVKTRFCSKVVVPQVPSGEPESREVPMADRDNVLRGGHQEERKGSRGQDGSNATEPVKTTVKKYFATTEADTEKFGREESKQGTFKANPMHGSQLTLMNEQNLKLVEKTKPNAVEEFKERDETSAKLCNIKERQTSGNLRETKEKSELPCKDDNTLRLGVKARNSSKRSGSLKSTRKEGTASRKFFEIRLPKAVKGGKERTVQSKEISLRRQSVKVGRARDDGGQDLSSHEPKHHKHRGRSHSVSPKLRNHTPQNKEHGKSMSPRRSDKDLSDWEKFERERNNTLAAFDSRYRRFGGGTSGLGGYSPRRRRSEAAIKTPSPPLRSPERRKPRAWDLPPPGMDRSMVAAISAAQHAAIQHAAAALSSVTPLVSGSVLLSTGATSSSASCGLASAPTMLPSLLQQVNPAVTAVTLTQATRPLRRLYVGNVPATVSDGELLEFMNAAMLSANANHLPGTKPCINCSVNVDKSYAFAEFITPEDATAALAFDGVALHGTTLKIRRPKDFAQPANGGAENASPILDMVSTTVPDSPRKVFVGGISSSLSGEKVKEIVTAFGQLKAYHWEVDKTKQPPLAYAFLEYMDPAAILRACAGLNGMKLGTRFLTVVQATPDASPEVASTDTPSYGVPEHAKTLLQVPSRILELQNLITGDEMSLMSKQETDEITEDIRLECSRFGNVKSMHIVQFQSALDHEKGTFPSNMESCEDLGCEGKLTARVVNLEHTGDQSAQNNVPLQILSVDGSCSDILRSSSARDDTGPEFVEQSNVGGRIDRIQEEPNASRKVDCLHVGKVYVEYSREESACQAAHNLHGRTFAGRKVIVSYFPLKAYQKEFHKGLGPRTYDEKQALALAVQSHLTAHIKG